MAAVQAIIGRADPKREDESVTDGGAAALRVPRGTFGEGASRLLGVFVVARVWQWCMHRASIPEERRPGATLYVDETANDR